MEAQNWHSSLITIRLVLFFFRFWRNLRRSSGYGRSKDATGVPPFPPLQPKRRRKSVIGELLLCEIAGCTTGMKSELTPRAPSLLRAHAPGGFGENLPRNLPQRDVEFEHGRFRSAPPPARFPMCAHKLEFRPGGQIEQQRSFLAIKLLRESRDRLWIPGRAIR